MSWRLKGSTFSLKAWASIIVSEQGLSRDSFLWFSCVEMGILFRFSFFQTPLHFASMSGNVEACRHLLAAGSDLFATNAAGYTPLEVSQMASEQGAACVLLEAMGKFFSFSQFDHCD